MRIETRTVETCSRSLSLPTVDGLEVRAVGSRADVHASVHAGYVVTPDVQIRASDDAGRLFQGHPAVFDSPTWIGSRDWGFEEVVARSAFNKTIADRADVRFVHNHNPDLLFARVASETLRLDTDKRGLVAEADWPTTSYADDVAELLDRGDISQMSFAFRAIKEQWELIEPEDRDPFERRTLLELALVDVSTVTWPAYDDTDAQLLRQAYNELGKPKDDDKRPDPEPPRSTPHTTTIDAARKRLRMFEETNK